MRIDAGNFLKNYFVPTWANTSTDGKIVFTDLEQKSKTQEVRKERALARGLSKSGLRLWWHRQESSYCLDFQQLHYSFWMRATRHCQPAASRREGTGLFIAFENIHDDVLWVGNLRDVMFRETGGTVVEKPSEIGCLQEGTLEKPAVHGHRQQVFWGRGVSG